jgi:ArsR family transcriptional regulator
MDDKRFQKVAKALADPRRFDIFQTIATNEAGGICSGSVCQTVDVAQATVSHHLKELTEADLIVPNCKGQFKYFTANNETMSEYIAELQNRLQIRTAV